MVLVCLRWGIVLIILGVIARKAVLQDWPVLRQHLVLFAVLGTLGFTCFNVLFYVAAHSTTALNLGIVQGMMPALVLLGMFFAFRTPIRGIQLLGVGITLAGVVVVAAQGSVSRLLDLQIQFGDLLMMCACCLYAGYTVWLRRRPDVQALSQFTVMAAAAFISSIPLAGYEIVSGSGMLPSARGWLLIFFIALLPSLAAQILFIRGVEDIGPARASVFTNLVPIVAACFAVVFLGEQFALYHGLALCLVLGGIWLSERHPAAH